MTRSGSIELGARESSGLSLYQITGAGIGHLPQGRRIWPSLGTHEHLAIVGAEAGSRWLAPTIVEQLVNTLRLLVEEGQKVFLIEQNLEFATALGHHVLVMVNGRITADLATEELLADQESEPLPRCRAGVPR